MAWHVVRRVTDIPDYLGRFCSQVASLAVEVNLTHHILSVKKIQIHPFT